MFCEEFLFRSMQTWVTAALQTLHRTAQRLPTLILLARLRKDKPTFFPVGHQNQCVAIEIVETSSRLANLLQHSMCAVRTISNAERSRYVRGLILPMARHLTAYAKLAATVFCDPFGHPSWNSFVIREVFRLVISNFAWFGPRNSALLSSPCR